MTLRSTSRSLEEITRQPPLTPLDIIASVIADGRTAGADGTPRVGRQTRKKAQTVLDALAAAGWRVLRK
jgi:hypothetical protein